jgi:hypothetical protein
VYYQPPPNLFMNYPCIRYELDDVRMTHANDAVYNSTRRYQITIIDENPDSVIAAKFEVLPKCSFDRSYARDGLNHFVFNLFF